MKNYFVRTAVLIVFLLGGCQGQALTVTSTNPAPIETEASESSATEPPPTVMPTPAVDPALTAWLNEHAVLLHNHEGRYGNLSDLEPLREMIGDARVVGLGEGTHGTHEFYTMKNRLVMFLVAEMGFDVLAVEGGWQSARFIDEAIHAEDFYDYYSDLEDNAIVAHQTWLDLLGVLAFYNVTAELDQHEQVTFYGLDVVDPGESMAAVRDFLALIDSEDTQALADRYDDCLWLYDITQYKDAPTAVKTACRASASAVYDQLFENQDAFAALTSFDDMEVALINARQVVQAEQLWSLPDEHAARDELLAQRAIDLVENGEPGSRVIVWAHNAHVGVGDFEGWPVMGDYLRDHFGSDYVAVGTFFGEGSFRSTLGGGARRVFDSGPPLEGSVEETLNTAEDDRFALNLANLSPDDPQAGWFFEPHPARWIGNFYNPDRPEDTMIDLTLAEAFDIAIFIRNTTPSRDLR